MYEFLLLFVGAIVGAGSLLAWDVRMSPNSFSTDSFYILRCPNCKKYFQVIPETLEVLPVPSLDVEG